MFLPFEQRLAEMIEAFHLAENELIAQIEHVAAHFPDGPPGETLESSQGAAQGKLVKKLKHLPQAEPDAGQLPGIGQQDADGENEP